MAVMCSVVNGVGVAAPETSLTAANAGAFREDVMNWLATAGVRTVAVDLNGVDFLDSAGLGVLIALLKRVKEGGGTLRIAGPQPRVRLVFEITRANRIFAIFDTVADAVRAGDV